MLGAESKKNALYAAAVVAGALSSVEALAFDAVSRPWAPTPERFIEVVRDHREARPSPAISALGLQAVSWRANGAPAVLWSAVTPAPRALSAEGAERAALEAAIAIAPELGVEASDLFVLGSTPLEFSAIDPVAHVRSWISVTLGQTYRNLPIGGGVLVFVFRDGNLASVRNELAYVALADQQPVLSATQATKLAVDAAKQLSSDAALVAAGALEVWAPSDQPEDARLAFAVKTRSMSPRTELTFHVDAKTGAILAADDQIRWADGEGRVRISVDTLNTTAGTVPFVAKAFGLPNGATDGDGDTLQTGTARLTYDGPYATVDDQAGQQLESFNVQFTGPFKNYDLTPTVFSQADPFVHINRVKEYARTLAPNMQWIDQKLTINVNINDTCNAFWDGATVNFFRAGGGCNNTARISGVVYHEFGHGFHQFLTNNVVGSVGEGTGDFLAALMLDDATVGRGFATNGAGIRQIDTDRVFPGDVQNEVHEDGLIWASALWDMRTALEAKHGRWAGKMISARIFVLALTQGPGLTSAYPAVIAADDDDNNPANGTPNSCEINAAFDLHGLVDGGVLNHTLAGTRSFAQINHVAPGAFTKETAGVKLTASAENRSTCGTVDLASMRAMVARGATGGTFSAVPMTVSGPLSSATISDLNEGDTFRYYFEITADGYTYQNGSADSPHMGFVKRAGESDIMREKFESGFGAWTHGAITGDRVDDWEVGAPAGLVFDPFEPREGASVAGTDLGGVGGPSGTDGVSKRSTYLQSAAIPTTGMENIQLGLWHHHAIAGTLRIKVDGVEVWSYRGDGTAWSGGWRYVTVPLAASARDNSAGIVLRFESESAATNELGGWSLDDVAVTGVAIPPPPPPPEEPKDPLPMEPEEPMNGNGDGNGNGNGNGDGPDLPEDTAPMNPQQEFDDDELPTKYVGSVGGSCACVRKPADHGLLGGALLLVGLGLTLAKRRRAR